jgi:NodT family efflux transporter outer membrane factor (OMF) lipoprotein
VIPCLHHAKRKARDRSIARAYLLGIVLSVSGCAVGPDFETPGAVVQNNWLEKHDSRVETKTDVKCLWWRVFRDPTLDELVERASQQNLPVQVAGLRILEARAQMGVAIGNMYPQTQEGTGDVDRVRISSRVLETASLPHKFAYFDIGMDAAWELDFWGRFRRNVEAADAAMLATVADYNNALVSLTAEVARTYTSMRTFEVLIRISRENAKTQKDGLDIAQSRFSNGATSELDVAQARALYESTLADIPQLQASLQQAKNALSILLGLPPGAVEALLRGPHRIPSASRRVAIGLPAELLRRRPDIRSAELNAAAESARIGVAEADLYPRFILLGDIGVQASNAARLFAPGSLAYIGGPGFRWSILNYGRITNNVRAQDVRFQQALVNYENTVLKAAQEVEDALIGFLKTQESASDLQKSVDAARLAVELSLIQYREGAVDYQRVTDSQTRLLTEMNRLAETRSSIATNLIAVYKALGGGWEVAEGKPIVSEALQAQMASRTNWGNLLPPPPPPRPTDLTPPPPASAMPPVLPPDW